MCRAIARQCQMDPKHYMPQLEGFANIAKGSTSHNSPHFLMMHYRVNTHLKRYKIALDYFIRMLLAILDVCWDTSDKGDKGDERESIEELIKDVKSAGEGLVRSIEDNDLYTYTLPKLSSVEQYAPPSTVPATVHSTVSAYSATIANITTHIQGLVSRVRGNT